MEAGDLESDLKGGHRASCCLGDIAVMPQLTASGFGFLTLFAHQGIVDGTTDMIGSGMTIAVLVEAGKGEKELEELLTLGTRAVDVAIDIHATDDLVGYVGIGGTGDQQVGIALGLGVVVEHGTEFEHLVGCVWV